MRVELRTYILLTKNNTGGGDILKLGDSEKFKYEEAYKISWGLRNTGGKAFRGAVTEGCIIRACINSR